MPCCTPKTPHRARALPGAAATGLLQQDQVFTATQRRALSMRGAAVGGEVVGGENWGCGQCPHFGSRTGSYWCRTGPNCGGFRGSGGYSRAGVRFESHLGHVFSLFRGLEPLSVHNLFTYGPLRGPFLWVAVTVAGGSFSLFGQRWRCLLVHGPGCRQLHDWTLAGGAVLLLLVCIS